MKKFITITLALALVFTLFVPALAANETEAQTNLSFTYSVSEPTYTVTIPGELQLNIEYTDMFIEVSDVDNLGDKSIYVTFEGTQFERSEEFYALYLDTDVNTPQRYLAYELYDVWGGHMGCEYNGDLNYNTLQQGQVFAIFGENGTQMIQTYIDPYWQTIIEPNVTFTGYIIFGISLQGN